MKTFREALRKAKPQFAPWVEDPDPPDYSSYGDGYWQEEDYEELRKRLRAYKLGEPYKDAVRPWNEEKHVRVAKGEGGGGRFGTTGIPLVERRKRALAALKETGTRTDELGPGYSKSATIKAGVIHTDNVYDAVLALTQDRAVELKQPKQVSTLIKALGEVSKTMVEGGETAPTFDLCKVTVKGTNLFCADTKGIPRIKMPQMDEVQTKEFIRYLSKLGFESEKDTEKSANLRATQNQLDAAKVFKFYERIRNDKSFKGDDKRLVVSRDDYVLDGHHHWAAQIAADTIDNNLGDHKTKVFRVDIDIIPLYKLAMKFTGGKGAKGVADTVIDALRQWSEEKHPRVPKGEAGGGRFGLSGAGARSMAATTEPGEMSAEKQARIRPAIREIATGKVYRGQRGEFHHQIAEREDLPFITGKNWDRASLHRERYGYERGYFDPKTREFVSDPNWDSVSLLTEAQQMRKFGALTELRARKPKEAEPVPLPKGRVELCERVSKQVAAEFGVDPDTVITDKTVTHFNMGQDKNIAAATCNLGTLEINIYPHNVWSGVNTTEQEVRWSTVHEIGHLRYQTMMNEYIKQVQAGRQGEIYDKMRPFHTGDYLDQLVADDGVTEYSKGFWAGYAKKEVKLNLALHETIAEMMRVQDKTKQLKGSPQWQAYYQAVMESYDMIVKSRKK